MQTIKAVQSFGNAVTGETFRATQTYDVSDAYAAEVITAGLAVAVEQPQAEEAVTDEQQDDEKKPVKKAAKDAK